MRKIDLIRANEKFRKKHNSQLNSCFRAFLRDYDPYMKLLDKWLKSDEIRSLNDNAEISFSIYQLFLIHNKSYPVILPRLTEEKWRRGPSMPFLGERHAKTYKDSIKFFKDNFPDMMTYLKSLPPEYQVSNTIIDSLRVAKLFTIENVIKAQQAYIVIRGDYVGEILQNVYKTGGLNQSNLNFICENPHLFFNIYQTTNFIALCTDCAFLGTSEPLQHVLDAMRRLMAIPEKNQIQLINAIRGIIDETRDKYSNPAPLLTSLRS